MNQKDLQSVSKRLEEAKKVLILVSANPSLDSVAAGLALKLSLGKKEKSVVFSSPTLLPSNFKQLIGANAVANSIGSRNLVISFDYIEDSIEKVSYNIENNKFNLVIEPKDNKPSLDPSKVSYSYVGADAEIIFIVGASKLEELGKFYKEEEKTLTDKFTVNIDNKKGNNQFAEANLVDSQAASCAEVVIELIKSLNLPVDSDICTNLYTGLKANTSNFQAGNVTASTFEAAAWCLKNNAQKSQFSFTRQPSLTQKQVIKPKTEEEFKIPPPFSEKRDQVKPSFLQQKTSPENKEAKPPPDWFKPKIYSSNGSDRK